MPLSLTIKHIDHLKAKEAAFGKEKSNNLKNMKLDLDVLEREIPKHEKQLTEIKRALTGAESRIRKLEVEETQIRFLSDKAAGLNIEKALIKGQLNELTGINSTCPMCKQKVSKDHLENEQLKLSRKIGEIATEEAQVKKALDGG